MALEGLLGALSSAMPTMAMPASVMPLSQQIAAMPQPNLTVPQLGGPTTMPSLGVDTTMPTIQAPQMGQAGGPNLLQQLASGLASFAPQQGQSQSAPMQWSPMNASRPAVQLPQVDLLAYLNSIGGMR